jgi:hypothetical protein
MQMDRFNFIQDMMDQGFSRREIEKMDGVKRGNYD